jgi:hypothetical protein
VVRTILLHLMFWSDLRVRIPGYMQHNFQAFHNQPVPVTAFSRALLLLILMTTAAGTWNSAVAAELRSGVQFHCPTGGPASELDCSPLTWGEGTSTADASLATSAPSHGTVFTASGHSQADYGWLRGTGSWSVTNAITHPLSSSNEDYYGVMSWGRFSDTIYLPGGHSTLVFNVTSTGAPNLLRIRTLRLRS